MKKIVVGALAALSLTLTACNQNAAKNDEHAMHASAETQAGFADYKIGDIVPNDKVCMVNNEYMGRDQLEVQVDGKTYYGCCEMCQERLPNDPTVREAIDPVSNKPVDKATAVIALTDANGAVAYFENNDTYNKYLKSAAK